VSVRQEGTAVILEPVDEWPEGGVESFIGVAGDFHRPEQGAIDETEKLGGSSCSIRKPEATR
jgi:hypothetical protein